MAFLPILLIGLLLCISAFVLPFWLRWFETRKLERLCATRRAIVLTYDDGPSEETSMLLKNLLESRGVRATFFVLGRQSERFPRMISHLRDGGHEIGSHSYNHLNGWKHNPVAVWNDVESGINALRSVGLSPSLLRPPFGKATLAGWIQCWTTGNQFAFWTIDSQDSWSRRPVSDVLAELDAKQGGVVLMHDFEKPHRGPAPEQHLSYLLDLTGALVDYANEHGYTILPFGELVERSRR